MYKTAGWTDKKVIEARDDSWGRDVLGLFKDTPQPDISDLRYWRLSCKKAVPNFDKRERPPSGFPCGRPMYL